jgi:uncharacterized protein with GYD domain
MPITVKDDFFKFWEESIKDVSLTKQRIKKLKKSIKEKLDTYQCLCGIKRGTHFKEWRENNEKLLKLFSDTMLNHRNISSGNIVVLLSFFESFIVTLKEMHERIKNIKDKILFDTAQEVILERQKELVKVFSENEKNPMTLQEFKVIIQDNKGD